MLFRQLFEPISSTYTYLLGSEETGEAILIDPVIVTQDRDLAELSRLGLKLAWTVDTHVHADHITAALDLRKRTGCKIAAPAPEGVACADLQLQEGQPLQTGDIVIHSIHTPGHTSGHFSYLVDGRVFTGDALLIDGCGRTDFQNGDTDTLYDSVRRKLFALPEETLVYPAHDYQNRHVSSIAQEKARNPRLGEGKSLEEFRAIMAGLNLPYPAFIDYAVPGNKQCGVCPDQLPDKLTRYCGAMTHSPQG